MQNPYAKMKYIIPDIFKLYDHLEKNMRKFYSNGVSNKKYGAITGVTARKDGKEAFYVGMKDKSTRDPSQEQLLDRNYKTSDGESAEDTRKRMNIFFNRILKEYEENKIAVVSHRGSDKILFIKLV